MGICQKQNSWLQNIKLFFKVNCHCPRNVFLPTLFLTGALCSVKCNYFSQYINFNYCSSEKRLTYLEYSEFCWVLCTNTKEWKKRPSLDTAKRILKSPGIQASSSFAKIWCVCISEFKAFFLFYLDMAWFFSRNYWS